MASTTRSIVFLTALALLPFSAACYAPGGSTGDDPTAISDATEGAAAPLTAAPAAASRSRGAALSVHATLGLPSPASTDNWDDYLSVKSGYVASYNSSRKVPNWVSWELNATYLGSAGRSDSFHVDGTLPSLMPQATLSDYAGSGYDRGHMCPSGDRTTTHSANVQTFFLSNVVPQAAHNNRGPWEALESYSRRLASSGRELFVIAGGVFPSRPSTIGNGVHVPSETFKVVVVLGAPGQGASSVTAATRVIGILVPNDDSELETSADWKGYRVPVRTIEEETGFDFLADVPTSIQEIVETRVDDE